MKIDKKIIKELSDYLDEFNLTELEYTEKDTKIKVSKTNISINNQNIPSSKSNLTSDTSVKKDVVKSKELGLSTEFEQSNVEGELVNIIQNAREKFDGMIINAAAFTHTSIAIRVALSIFKKPIIELHISNIYKREEFRQKSLISDIVTGGIFGLGSDGYILAIISMQKLLNNENQ